MTHHWFRASRILMRLRRVVRNDQLILAFLALVVGAAGGMAVVLFRDAIVFVQTVFYGSGTEHLFQYVQGLPAWRVVAAPTVGGLVVGLLVRCMLPGRRPVGVADVIEAVHSAAAICRRGSASVAPSSTRCRSASAPRWAARGRRCIWARRWPTPSPGACA